MNLQDVVLSLRAGTAGGTTGAIFVLAIVAFAAVFAIGAIMFFVYARSPQGKIDALLDARAEDRKQSKWPMRIVVLLMLAFAVVAINYQMSRPSTCAQCHTKGGYVSSVKQTAHKDVGCLGCHGGTGLTGGLQTTASYGRWILVYTSMKRTPAISGVVVPDVNCLKCHAEVRTKTVTRRGVRVRHKDFLDNGAQCRDCHNSVGHGDIAREPTSPSMDDCVVCHDGKKASSECKTCHVKDELQVAAVTMNFPKLREAGSSNCYGCHDEKPCLRCHGITMPHPRGWAPNDGGPGISGSHALEGFTKRELCWRCHYSNGKPFQRPTTNGGFTQTVDGCPCHGSFGNMHGGTSWIKRHGTDASGKTHGPDADCGFCHQIDKLCVQCHDPSILDQYKPVPGNEKYPRQIPKPPGYWDY
ncbi:MAG TPA: cytochrome c3 family protein [Coriobacteriia bacterium]|nr:cytochrome c3 family protein [Coriobacteriia bacterium]